MSLESSLGLDQGGKGTREEHWIPLADIMTGLMMMFLLVAIVFMIKVQTDADRISDIAVLYDQTREDIYKDLQHEFQNDLPKWGATLSPDLTIRFREPDVLFDTGRDVLKPKFSAILSDFFPRYIRILTQPKYRASIEEIRIEGHTSSIWNGNTPVEDAYFQNMALSQARTRTTLQYVLELPTIVAERDWLRANLTANGLSSSKLIHRADGNEDSEASQRVEFRVRTNADARIAQMLRAAGQK
jgi:outer membrane protein OmpA-like peptidoglycan-associated protein